MTGTASNPKHSGDGESLRCGRDGSHWSISKVCSTGARHSVRQTPSNVRDKSQSRDQPHRFSSFFGKGQGTGLSYSFEAVMEGRDSNRGVSSEGPADYLEMDTGEEEHGARAGPTRYVGSSD